MVLQSICSDQSICWLRTLVHLRPRPRRWTGRSRAGSSRWRRGTSAVWSCSCTRGRPCAAAAAVACMHACTPSRPTAPTAPQRSPTHPVGRILSYYHTIILSDYRCCCRYAGTFNCGSSTSNSSSTCSAANRMESPAPYERVDIYVECGGC